MRDHLDERHNAPGSQTPAAPLSTESGGVRFGTIAASEAPASLLLLADPSLERIHDYLRRSIVCVGTESGEAVAVAILEIRGEEAELHNIAVAEDRQRNGLGRRLLRVVVDLATSKGVQRLLVGTGNSSLGALLFYQKNGFRVVGVIPGFFDADQPPIEENGIPCRDMIRLGLDLNPTRIEAREQLDGESGFSAKVALVRSEAESQALAAFLTNRIYEFNARATGYHDGTLLAGCVRGSNGEIVAGFNGHTWGGSCELANVWVHERYRGHGIGTFLLRSAEAEAVARGCLRVFLATHNFQAPGFYESMGYERTFTIEGLPRGYADILYVKVLQRERDAPSNGSETPTS